MLQTVIPVRPSRASSMAWSSRSHKLDKAEAASSVRSYETSVVVEAGGTIFREGDSALYFYKVLSGSVRLVKAVADGHRQICDFNLAGDLIGISNAAEHEFTAEAIEDCTLIRYRRKDIPALINSDAAFACELQTLTAKGLSNAYAHMARLCHRSAYDRVARFLLSMADRAEDENGWIDLPMSRVDIADYLGMAHETVSRAFTHLKKSKAIVEPALNRIRLVDRDGLESRLDAA